MLCAVFGRVLCAGGRRRAEQAGARRPGAGGLVGGWERGIGSAVWEVFLLWGFVGEFLWVGFGAGFAGLGAEVSGPEDVGDGVLKPGVLPDIPAAPEHFGGSGLLCGAGSGRDGCAGGSGVRRELCADGGGVPCGAAGAGGEGVGWGKGIAPDFACVCRGCWIVYYG